MIKYLFGIMEIRNGSIILRGRERIECSGSSTPRVTCSGSYAPRVTCYGSSAPRVTCYGLSAPRVTCYDSSAPTVVCSGSYAPRVECYDSSAPRVVCSGSSAPPDLILLGNEIGRGYTRSIILDNGVVYFMAGCHKFTLAKARAHWGSPAYPKLDRGEAYLRLIDFAEAEAGVRGWIK